MYYANYIARNAHLTRNKISSIDKRLEQYQGSTPIHVKLYTSNKNSGKIKIYITASNKLPSKLLYNNELE